jgi:hypothetical protein
MLTVTQEDRHEVANRLQNSPMGSLDPAASLLTLRGFCPLCGQEVPGFRDELSLREYRISGLCQKCQDTAFGSEEGDEVEVSTDPEQFSELEDVNWNELD